MARTRIERARRGASKSALAAFEALKAAGNAGSGIVGGAQAYWNQNAAEAERLRQLQAQEAAARAAQQQAAADAARRAQEEAVRQAQERSRSEAYQQQQAQNAAAQAAQPMKIKDAKNLNQGLKIAGRVLSAPEIRQLTKATGKNAERVIQQAVGKGLTLGSNVVNKYQKGAYTDPMLAMARMATPAFAMAAGKDSDIFKQIRDAGRLDKGSALYIGSKGSTATVLPRKTPTGVGGNRPMVGGASGLAPTTTDAAPITEAPVETYSEPVMPEMSAESKYGPGGPGAALDGGATGVRGRRSRWRSAGKTSKGTANLKIMGQTGRSSGVNLAVR